MHYQKHDFYFRSYVTGIDVEGQTVHFLHASCGYVTMWVHLWNLNSASMRTQWSTSFPRQAEGLVSNLRSTRGYNVSIYMSSRAETTSALRKVPVLLLPPFLWRPPPPPAHTAPARSTSSPHRRVHANVIQRVNASQCQRWNVMQFRQITAYKIHVWSV